MDAKVLTLPLPVVDVDFHPTSSGGTFAVQLTIRHSGNYPMKGGQGDYQPRTVLLMWDTDDGTTWTFRHAIICGAQIEKKTGEPGAFTTSQTLYLGDPNYADCEPSWLAGLVARFTPGKVTA